MSSTPIKMKLLPASSIPTKTKLLPASSIPYTGIHQPLSTSHHSPQLWELKIQSQSNSVFPDSNNISASHIYNHANTCQTGIQNKKSHELSPNQINEITNLSNLCNGKNPLHPISTLEPQHQITNQNHTNHINTQDEFVTEIIYLFNKDVRLQQAPTNNKILFIFESSKQAAVHNANVLACYNFDLHSALLAQENTQLFYGSEFKKASDLKKKPSHPLWKHTIKILDHGAHFPLQKIDSTSRNSDNTYHQSRGNHKTVTENKEILQKLID
jgi:hypothetical protein